MVLDDSLAATAAQTLPVLAFAASIELAVHSRVVSARFTEMEHLLTRFVDHAAQVYEERAVDDPNDEAGVRRRRAELLQDSQALATEAAAWHNSFSPELARAMTAPGSAPAMTHLFLRMVPAAAFSAVMLLVVVAECVSVLHLADVTVPKWSAKTVVWAMISAMILLVAIPAVTGPVVFLYRFQTWPFAVARKVLAEHPQLRDEIMAEVARSRWRWPGLRLLRWLDRPRA